MRDLGPRRTMYEQYRTLCRGSTSLVGALRKQYGQQAVAERIALMTLRKAERYCEQWYTEMVYLHAKVMIVDDRLTIIGSANLNDRSLEPGRDSDIAVVLRDCDTVPSLMNGHSYAAGPFARSLRMELWRCHLDLEDAAALQDPTVDGIFHGVLLACAQRNTELLESVFPGMPSDRIRV